MARINIPLDVLTSRLNLSGRFDGVGAQSITSRFANLRPIGEFLDIKRLSKPRDFGEVQSRVNYNLSYFSSNYAVIFVMLSIYSLLNNLTLTFVIVLVVGGMYGIGKLEGRDLDLGFVRATSSQLYTALFIVAIPLGLWSSPISTFLWLIGATGVTILGHAALLEKDVSAEFEVSSSAVSLGAPVYRHDLTASDLRDIELRQQARPKGERIAELYDQEQDYGVGLDKNTFAARQGDLYFTGYDADGKPAYAYYDDYSEAEDESNAALVRSALERISRAKTKGKTNVELSLEEIEALERRNGVQQHGYISPPATPKSSKSKLHGLVGGKTTTKKKSSAPSTPKTTPKSNTKAKISRKNSTDGVPIFHPNSPSVLVRGPDGVPMYAPLAYLPPEYSLPQGRSRSTSQGSKRDTTPPEQVYSAYPVRHYRSTSGVRPASASSSRPFTEHAEVRAGRSRAGSAAQYLVNDDYSPMPAVHGRKLSGSPYSSLRRVPQASSPLVPRPEAPQHRHSDPSVNGRRESSSSSDGQEAYVEVVPDGASYTINKTQPRNAETRRRKARR